MITQPSHDAPTATSRRCSSPAFSRGHPLTVEMAGALDGGERFDHRAGRDGVYSYIVGLSSAGHPKRPLVVTPLIPGTNRFDPKPFNGYAVVLTADCSGTRSGPVFPINKNGEVIDASGKHILDPANPIWGGEAPVIAWPE